MTTTLSHLLCQGLIDAGVDTLYCLPGVQNDDFYNVLVDHPALSPVVTRHEQACSYMATGAALVLPRTHPDDINDINDERPEFRRFGRLCRTSVHLNSSIQSGSSLIAWSRWISRIDVEDRGQMQGQRDTARTGARRHEPLG